MKTTLIDALSLAHHLGIAAEAYEVNVADLRKLQGEKTTAAETRADPTEAARLRAAALAEGRLADQFERQAKECRTWCEALYNHDSLAMDGDRFVAREIEREAAA